MFTNKICKYICQYIYICMNYQILGNEWFLQINKIICYIKNINPKIALCYNFPAYKKIIQYIKIFTVIFFYRHKTVLQI